MAGAGGEVFGAANKLCNVVAVESDHKQFLGLRSLIAKRADEDFAALEQGKEWSAPMDDGSSSSISQGGGGGVGVYTEQMSQTNIFSTYDSNPICAECNEEIERDAVVRENVCEVCNNNRPLHENCCVRSDGKLVCLSHMNEHGDSDESVEEDE